MELRPPPMWLWSVSAALCSSLAAPQATAQEPAAPAQDLTVTSVPTAPGKGVAWKMGDTTLKVGGYVKLDLIHDFDAIDSTDSFDPRTIPTDDTDGANTRLHARQSRLNLELRGPSSTDPYRVFVEGDFFSTNNGFRLRHAYFEMGRVLGGQTWTTFMDEDGMPETLDFESPIGFPQIRQAQARYTKKLDNGDSYAFSIEDPASSVIAPAGDPGVSEELLPDLVARYIWKTGERGHVQASAFGGVSSFNPDDGTTENVPLWGLNLSTKLATFDQDSAILQLTYGDGVGRYRGGVTAAPDSGGNLEAVTTMALLASYEHHWSKEYRSTVMYSWAAGDLPSGAPATASEELQYAAANIIWQFSDRAWTGFEYLYGTNETFDGSFGDAHRIQFSLKLSL